MKRYLILITLIAAVSLSACKKDDTSSESEPTRHIPVDETPDYVLGQFNPARHLATMLEFNDTIVFDWDTMVSPVRLRSVAHQSTAYPIGYDAAGRQTSVHIAPSDLLPEHTLNFAYDGNALTSIVFSNSNGTQIISGAVSCNDNHIAQVVYSGVSSDVVANMVSDYLPLQTDQSHNVIQSFSIASIKCRYDWHGDNVENEHITANATADLSVGELADGLHLDTSFYRLLIESFRLDTISPLASALITPQLIDEFVQAISDSNCHITVNVAMDIAHNYDAYANPIYGFWGLGFLGNTRVLSHNNITASTRSGEADVHLHINLPANAPSGSSWQLSLLLTYLNVTYPDGFDYTYPIDLSRTYGYTYTYNADDMPATRTYSNSTSTYTYYPSFNR